MAILNYTTTVAADKTVAEIQVMLARHGARTILTDYNDANQPAAISFLIETPHGERSFRLPARAEAVLAVLDRQYAAGRVPRRFANREQATRVCWRIVKDWLAAQLAIIETEMVTLTQVMLPYMVGQDGVTVYERLERSRLLLPEGATTGAPDR